MRHALNKEKFLALICACLFAWFLARLFISSTERHLPKNPVFSDYYPRKGAQDIEQACGIPSLSEYLAIGERNPFEPYGGYPSQLYINSVHAITLDRTSLRIQTTLNCSIAQSPLNQMNIELQEGYNLDTLETKAPVKEYKVHTAKNRRLLTIQFEPSISGRYKLGLSLTRKFPSIPEEIKIPELYPDETTKEIGIVVVFPDIPGYKLRTTRTSGLTSLNRTKLKQLLPDLEEEALSHILAFYFKEHPYELIISTEPLKRPAPKKPRPEKRPIKPQKQVTKESPRKEPPPEKTPKVVKRKEPPPLVPPKSARPLPRKKKPVRVTPSRKGYELPVSIVGIVSVAGKRYVILRDKRTKAMVKKEEGEQYLDVTIYEIRPNSVVVQNSKGDLFDFTDFIRQKFSRKAD